MPETTQLCQRCHVTFTSNGPAACRFHPESFAGEDSQRWTAPGATPPEGASTVSYFYACCGAATIDAPGCCTGRHVGFDEELGVAGRRADARPPSP